MRVRWTPAAADDLEAIWEYLARNLPAFAQSTIQEIYQAILALRTNPNRGRAGREGRSLGGRPPGAGCLEVVFRMVRRCD